MLSFAVLWILLSSCPLVSPPIFPGRVNVLLLVIQIFHYFSMRKLKNHLIVKLLGAVFAQVQYSHTNITAIRYNKWDIWLAAVSVQTIILSNNPYY
jgi:hypothetical protein